MLEKCCKAKEISSTREVAEVLEFGSALSKTTVAMCATVHCTVTLPRTVVPFTVRPPSVDSELKAFADFYLPVAVRLRCVNQRMHMRLQLWFSFYVQRTSC